MFVNIVENSVHFGENLCNKKMVSLYTRAAGDRTKSNWAIVNIAIDLKYRVSFLHCQENLEKVKTSVQKN